jgi:hypothetical protein
MCVIKKSRKGLYVPAGNDRKMNEFVRVNCYCMQLILSNIFVFKSKPLAEASVFTLTAVFIYTGKSKLTNYLPPQDTIRDFLP